MGNRLFLTLVTKNENYAKTLSNLKNRTTNLLDSSAHNLPFDKTSNLQFFLGNQNAKKA